MTKRMDIYVSLLLKQKGLQPSRVSVFMAILQLWKEQKHQNPFQITRRKVMKKSGIKSIATYHRCINELKDRKLIIYQPSYDPKLGSKVVLK